MTAALAVIFIARAAAAHDASLIARYAAAVRYFNPAIDSADALSLAAATLEQADRQHIDARLLVAIVTVESRWNPRAVSAAGARGLGQLMPQTARGLGVDADDPLANIAGAAQHLRWLLDRFADRDPPTQALLAVAAYNAGAAAVDRYGGVPPYSETRAYVRRVITLWRRLSGEARE